MDFIHRESHVAGRLGISRDTIREMRNAHLVEDADWKSVRNIICLTDVAAGKIAAALSLPAPATAVSPEKAAEMLVAEKDAATATTGAGLVDLIEELCVWRLTKNPHIIEAFAPGTDPMHRQNILRVRVKNAANFCRVGGDGKPMMLPARHVQVDLYELVGPCPRRKGRW